MKYNLDTFQSDPASSPIYQSLHFIASHEMADGVLITNADGIIEFVNTAFTTITGFTAEDLIGVKCSAKLQGPLTDKNTIMEIRQAALDDMRFQNEILNYKKDGTTFWNNLTITPIFNDQSQLTNLISITRDATARKHAELDLQRQRDALKSEVAEKTKALQNSLEIANQAIRELDNKNKVFEAAQVTLQESQERLTLAIQSNNIAVWDWNLATDEMLWDNLMLELYKVKKSKTLTSGYLVDAWSKTLHPNDRSRAQGELEDALNNKKPFKTEFRIIWPDGQVRHIKALAKVFFDDQGKPIRMLGTNVDITKSALVNQMKSEFIATAAHELRTPMTTIFGYAELLKDVPFDAEEQKEMITTIHTQSKTMIALLNDILDMEKLESQATKLYNFRHQPIAPILEALTNVFITDKNHNKVALGIADNLPDLNIDRTKIEQAIRNLLSNAYKFSPNNDEINMQVSEVVHEGSSKVLIAIQDHGIGMTPEQLNRVYEKFYRADQSGLIPGTGLGMAITKDMITHHGGTIEIESKLGVGTKVMLYLPVAS